MIRQVLAAAAIAGAAVCAAPLAFADPETDYPDTPGRYASYVPGMNYDAHLTGPCFNLERFTFGRGPGGEVLQCRWIENQWPPIPTNQGFWQATYELFGVQEVGSPCPKPQAAAQSPDGRPMLCLGTRGWQPGFFTREGFFPR